MSDPFSSVSKRPYILGTAIVLALGTITIASAQSPFASKKKKQAWEVAPTQTAPSQTTPSHSSQLPVYQSSSTSPLRGAPTSAPPSMPPANTPQASSYTAASYVSGNSAPPAPTYSSASTPPAQPTFQGGYNYQSPQVSSAPTIYEPPEQLPLARVQRSPVKPLPHRQSAQYQSPYPPAQPSGAPPSYPPQSAPPQSYPPNTYPGQQGPYGSAPVKRSWKEKLGLGQLATVFRGFLKGGAAAVNRDDRTNSSWKEEFVADAKAEFEVSAITDSGYEYGINLEARADYDKFRRGFGGRLPDCPPTEAGCASVLIAGVPTALRGHTSQFYTFGTDDAEETQIALESAHIFLRSAYGDLTVGRDDGAAALFSLGAPSLLAMGASNSTVDYTGLDSVKTVNDASGFSEKITYTSPRLLGDSIGFGVQFGGSYAPNARACGPNYCVKDDDGTGALSPDLEDIFEFGLALDRTFVNGLKMEATATYAKGSEKSAIAAFDDLQAFNLGAEASWMDITLGGSFLSSNNGLIDGDYQAWDVGATWKPSALGFTLGYGQAQDDLVNLTSDQIIAGVTYEFDRYTLGLGAQYIERESQVFNGLTVEPQSEKATALFIEGGVKF